MRVAITGASGLIGTALTARLTESGHTPVPVVRRSPGAGEIGWAPAEGRHERRMPVAKLDLDGAAHPDGLAVR